MHRWWLLAALLVLVAIVARARAYEPGAPAQTLQLDDNDGHHRLYIVPPEITDPRIVHNDNNNLVYFRAPAAPDARLLIFLGGARRLVDDFSSAYLREAARLGFRVIDVDFRYNPPGTDLCEGRADPNCFPAYRAQKVFGVGAMPGIEVAPPESIVNRITSLLDYLIRTYPNEGWEQYRTNGAPRWDRVVLTGFSQGSGLAAFLAKRVPVARVALLSSPWDHYGDGEHLAAWLSGPSATPPERWYGLYAAREGRAAWLAQAYAALGLRADHIRVLQGTPREQPGAAAPGMEYHWSVIGRTVTPVGADGQFLYRNDWDFVLGPGTG